jgi:hypothetical protein
MCFGTSSDPRGDAPTGLNGADKSTWKMSSLLSPLSYSNTNEQRVSPPPKASKPRYEKDFKAHEECDDKYGE